jgi:hypothetical protein
MLISVARSKHTWSEAPLEDGITSAIFASLRTMAPQTAWACCRFFLGDKLRKNGPAESEPVTRSDLEFWPHLPLYSGEGRFVEPDIQAIFEFASGFQLTILIEVKWDSSGHEHHDGETQLERQWKAVRGSIVGNSNVYHIYLIKDRGHEDRVSTIESLGSLAKEWQERSATVTWHELITELHLHSKRVGDGPVSRYAADLSKFLRKLGIAPFSGFDSGCVHEVNQQAIWRIAPEIMSWRCEVASSGISGKNLWEIHDR